MKRLKSVCNEQFYETPEQVVKTLNIMCRKHVEFITGCKERWYDHVYRIFYYDAPPFAGVAHNPLSERPVDFKKTTTFQFQSELHRLLQHNRKTALRLGALHPAPEKAWHLRAKEFKNLVKIAKHAGAIADVLEGGMAPEELGAQEIPLLRQWAEVTADKLSYQLNQKGVDMRIGIDITTLTLKGQVDTIVLISGDGDFIPAAKVARREGAEFILDPMWQNVNDELLEHVDGIQSTFKNPANGQPH